MTTVTKEEVFETIGEIQIFRLDKKTKLIKKSGKKLRETKGRRKIRVLLLCNSVVDFTVPIVKPKNLNFPLDERMMG